MCQADRNDVSKLPNKSVCLQIVKGIKVKTTTARKCNDFITRLNMKEMKRHCPKAEERLKNTNIRMSLIFADIEIAQVLRFFLQQL